MKGPLLIIGDLHAHNHKAHATLIDGMNSRLLDFVSCWEQALEKAKETGCEAILITGDVFHVRGSIRPSVYNKVAWCLREAVKRGLNVLIVAGNHDFENFHYGETAVDSLGDIGSAKHDAKVTVVSGPPTVVEIAGNKIGCIPYIHDTKDFLAAYDEMAAKGPDMMLIHQGIDDFEPDVPRTLVTAERLSKAYSGWVFAGHYHGAGRQGKVVSVGAPMMQTFGDTEDKGCWVYAPSSDSVQHYELNAPKFMTVSADDKLPSRVKGNIVRITAKTVAEAEAMKEMAAKAGAISVVATIDRAFTTAHARAIKLSSPEKMLADYIDSFEKYRPHKERLVKLFQSVCL